MPAGGRETIEHAGGEYGFGFVVRWSVNDFWADVTAFEVVSPADDGPALFHRRGWRHSEDLTSSLDEAEPYLAGHVKWDSCMEFAFSQPHWCGPMDIVRHAQLLLHVYRRAFELMGREPEEPLAVTILTSR